MPTRPIHPLPAAPRPRGALARLVLGVGALLLAGSVYAQGVDYRVDIDAPRQLDELLENNLELLRWRGDPRVTMDQLQRLVKEAPEEVRTLVATEGYYSPKITARLDTSGTTPVARISVDPGQPVQVSDVDIELRGFESTGKDADALDAVALRSSWDLPVGAPFRQPDWEAAKRDLLREISVRRYPRARLAETRATVDPDTRRAQLRVVVDSGPEARFGELRINGLQRYSRDIITNLNDIDPGEVYDQADLQALQTKLQDTGYFSTVEVSVDMSRVIAAELRDLQDGEEAPPEPDVEGPVTLPVIVNVTENKRKNVEVGVGFSTNTGARAHVSYDDLNVWGKRLESELIYEQRHQLAAADFFWPTKPNGFSDSVGAAVERTDLRGEVTTVATVAARRIWGSPRLEHNLTLELLTEKRVVGTQPSTRSKSLPLTYSVTRRALDNLILPTSGYVLNVQIGGALLPVLTDERFIRAYSRYLSYHPVGDAGTILLRAELGAVRSKRKLGVPSTFLFRAGGDQSVRGYGYQRLGVEEDGAIVGARYLATGSIEYQYWFRPPWGVAVFYDAGNAADSFDDLHLKSGYGIGARWRSPVGPISVDVAYGHAIEKFRLHFSLGFTF